MRSNESFGPRIIWLRVIRQGLTKRDGSSEIAVLLQTCHHLLGRPPRSSAGLLIARPALRARSIRVTMAQGTEDPDRLAAERSRHDAALAVMDIEDLTDSPVATAAVASPLDTLT